MKSSIVAFFLTLSIYGLALNPSRTYKQRPDRYNIKYKEIVIKSNDGKADIKLWYFPSVNESDKLMIIAHNGEGNMANYLRRVDRFKRIGYSVVTFDYRGYGESSEFEINPDMYIYPQFTDDLISVMDYCKKNFQATFDLYGWGIGAGLAAGVGCNRTDIKRIIADTPFLSLGDLEQRFNQQKQWKEVPERGYDPMFEPITSIKQASGENLKGILLIIGSNDVLFNSKDMEKLRSQNRKLVWPIRVIENPSRMDNFKANKEKYFVTIAGFLDDTK